MIQNSRDNTYIERDLEKEISLYVDDPEIIAIVGPRQAGKTTLLQHIYNQTSNATFITFENFKTLQLFDSNIDTFIERHITPYSTVFIDEFQYAETGGKGLKYIYDTTDTKIFLTGSSSIDLAVKGLKRLVGRVLTFRLYPLSFLEFLRYKDDNLTNTLPTSSEPIIQEVNPYYREFLRYGGYPRVVTESHTEKKKKLLEDIYNVYMLREVQELLNIADRKTFAALLKALSAQLSGRITWSNLRDITGYKQKAVKEKCHLLEETFIASFISPFHTNKQKELVKNPEVFFIDSGLRNTVLESYHVSPELHENFVFTEMVKAGYSPQYWRTKGGAEVDFVLNSVPYEVKQHLTSPKITRSFRSYLKTYTPTEAYILSESYTGTRTAEGIDVQFRPLYETAFHLD